MSTAITERLKQMSPELKKRIQTAVVGVSVIVLLLTLGGGMGAVIVSAAISIAMLYEFCEITMNLPDKKEKRFALMGSAWLVAFMNFWIAGGEFALLMTFFIGFVSYFLFTADKYEGQDLKTHFQELMYSVFGFVYLGFLPTYLVSLRQSAYGGYWTMLFLLIIWANDIGAYFAGHRFGKNKLYAHISPKKTWEGAAGGMAASVVISLLFKLTLFAKMSWFAAIAIPLVLGVVGPVGDLAESFLKRAFDKKDSGSLLPGHGGFLDRFDSVVLSLPIMYALTRMFGAV